MHGALGEAASLLLGWKNQARTIVHIADAPGHGQRLHGNYEWNDQLPDYDSDGLELKQRLDTLRFDTKVRAYV